MNAKYKINWLEIKTGKSGKQYMVMHLLDEAGKETQNVSTFNLEYTLSQEIEGQIVQNGNFKNWKPKLDPPQFIKNNSAYKEKIMNETIARKEGSITKFQNNKEWSIKVASSMNKAIDLAISEDNATPECILKWRKWIWNNWEVSLDDTDAISGKLL